MPGGGARKHRARRSRVRVAPPTRARASSCPQAAALLSVTRRSGSMQSPRRRAHSRLNPLIRARSRSSPGSRRRRGLRRLPAGVKSRRCRRSRSGFGLRASGSVRERDLNPEAVPGSRSSASLCLWVAKPLTSWAVRVYHDSAACLVARRDRRRGRGERSAARSTSRFPTRATLLLREAESPPPSRSGRVYRSRCSVRSPDESYLATLRAASAGRGSRAALLKNAAAPARDPSRLVAYTVVRLHPSTRAHAASASALASQAHPTMDVVGSGETRAAGTAKVPPRAAARLHSASLGRSTLRSHFYRFASTAASTSCGTLALGVRATASDPRGLIDLRDDARPSRLT